RNRAAHPGATDRSGAPGDSGLRERDGCGCGPTLRAAARQCADRNTRGTVESKCVFGGPASAVQKRRKFRSRGTSAGDGTTRENDLGGYRGTFRVGAVVVGCGKWRHLRCSTAVARGGGVAIGRTGDR